jgi:hypothetical protein
MTTTATSAHRVPRTVRALVGYWSILHAGVWHTVHPAWSYRRGAQTVGTLCKADVPIPRCGRTVARGYWKRGNHATCTACLSANTKGQAE